MSRPCPALLATLLTISFAASALAEGGAPGTAQPVEKPGPAVAAPSTDGVVYGPILARDPAVRGEIKRVYREQHEYNLEAAARLSEIAAAAAAETDADVRLVLDRDALELKKEIELRNAHYGLEIATLNEDAQRVADFERAIDQMLHPENYRPAPADPALEQQRRRELGLE